MADLTCPTCRGVRTVGGVGCGPGGCRPLLLKCSTCRGTGTITAERADWINAGERLRADRLTRDFSLREEATRLGVRASVLSDYEHGHLNPAECPR